jgi:mannan endo-1,4-beta-mannosidase
MHSSGLKSDEQWFQGYNNGMLALAENMFKAGGIPIICWHWKDPLQKTEQSAFYSVDTDFDLRKAFTDNTYETFNVNSPEYQAIIKDIDLISGYLKQPADKDVPVLWSPLHEAAGGWLWWGRDKVAKPCKQLWLLMYDRMTNHHKLNNLVWVWTCEEGGDALDWYPGDDFADIIGRDIYPYPNQREKNHTSRVANFERLKDIYNAGKIIALAENGAIPYPDSLINDGAEWSFFMPWYGDFTTDVNTSADWNYIMNHNYVITLEGMPGWDNYTLTTSISQTAKPKSSTKPTTTVRSRRGSLELNIKGSDVQSVELFNLRGAKIAVLSKDKLSAGTHRLTTKGIAKQMCFVRVRSVDNRVVTLPVRIE